MAHFYATIQGHRGEASRCGSKDSGVSGHIRGWRVGASVQCFFDEATGMDEVRIYSTGGSSGKGITKLIAVLRSGEGSSKTSAHMNISGEESEDFLEKVRFGKARVVEDVPANAPS